jgi:D-beta-D-heptose 7-phosphate kinase/D-beta-D-heptose 1-phosphate adenosyltransferase
MVFDPTASADADLAEAIPKLARASVLVVGDAMLDRYVFGTVSRISPEAPVPVLSAEREVALPGGAGNVVRNLTALGAAVAFVSVVGDDQAGSDLTGLIGGQPNVEPWLLVQGGRCTTVKTRFIARGQQLLRSDQETTGPIHAKLADRMLRIAGDALAATSVTVLSDYGKGVLAGDIATRIIEAARAAGRPVVVSPRGSDYERYAGADVIVPSLRELETVTGMSVSNEPRIAAAARWLRTAHGFGAVLVNRGAEGFSLIAADTELHLPPAIADAFDLSGSGDTAVSALAAGLAAGIALPVAARLANLATGVAAGQAGMAVAQGTDLLAMLTPQGRALRKIVVLELAAEQVERWRRMGLRTALITSALKHGEFKAGRMGSGRIDAARSACDRLVVGVEAPPDIDSTEAPRRILAEAAGLSSVDLVCLIAEGTQQEALQKLRPDLLIDASPSASLAELVRGWGGEIVAG